MKHMNNRGFTLVETALCFVILSVILVIASQIIHSSTEIYYLNRSTSYGMQAAQIVSTELRGEIEDALPLVIYDVENKNYSSENLYMNIRNDDKSIEFISSDGNQIMYKLEEDNGVFKLNRYSFNAYDSNNMNKTLSGKNQTYGSAVKVFDSKYIGMGYEVHDISFQSFVVKAIDRPINDSDKPKELEIGAYPAKPSGYPILVMKITVGNNQYDEYECEEYVALYNYYGINPNGSPFEKIGGITETP